MKRLAVLAIVAGGVLVGAPAGVAQHAGDPCVSNEEHRGHSAYAHHHIVVEAQAGNLGAGGHKPGEHRGYAGLCGVHAP
jgi:uncharacterized low-complexity protein